MKVYIVCKEPFPYGMAATQRIQCYAKAIISQGISCEVLVFARSGNGSSAKNNEANGIYEGVPFRYTGGSAMKPRHKILRISSEYYDRFMLRRYLSRNLHAGDIVLAYVNSDIDFMCKIISLVHSKRAKYVRELCEIPFYGSQKDSASLERILSVLFPECDGFITISDTLTNLAQQYKRSDAIIVQIPILVDFEKAEQSVQPETVSVPYILHAGSLYEQKDGITGMLAALGKAKSKLSFPVKMIMTGKLEESPDKAAIEKIILDYSLQECVEFVGYCNSEKINSLLSGSAFTVINKHDNIQNNYGFSTKLATYLAAGKAVIITDIGEAMNWLEDGETAWIVRRDENDALADAIAYAYANPDECKRIGENGKELCKKCFDWRSVSRQLTGFLSELQNL